MKFSSTQEFAIRELATWCISESEMCRLAQRYSSRDLETVWEWANGGLHAELTRRLSAVGQKFVGWLENPSMYARPDWAEVKLGRLAHSAQFSANRPGSYSAWQYPRPRARGRCAVGRGYGRCQDGGCYHARSVDGSGTAGRHRPTAGRAPAAPMPSEENGEDKTDPNDPKRKSVRLSHWALAVGEKEGEWYLLLVWANKRWAFRGRAEIPQALLHSLQHCLPRATAPLQRTTQSRGFTPKTAKNGRPRMCSTRFANAVESI